MSEIHSNETGSWSNQIGDWQWYIHGDGETSDYLELSEGFKGPGDKSDDQGIRITIVRPAKGPLDVSDMLNSIGWNVILERPNHDAQRAYPSNNRGPRQWPFVLSLLALHKRDKFPESEV